jgi:hypothetical protein
MSSKLGDLHAEWKAAARSEPDGQHALQKKEACALLLLKSQLCPKRGAAFWFGGEGFIQALGDLSRREILGAVVLNGILRRGEFHFGFCVR